jgi:hypothetical protein
MSSRPIEGACRNRSSRRPPSGFACAARRSLLEVSLAHWLRPGRAVGSGDDQSKTSANRSGGRAARFTCGKGRLHLCADPRHSGISARQCRSVGQHDAGDRQLVDRPRDRAGGTAREKQGRICRKIARAAIATPYPRFWKRIFFGKPPVHAPVLSHLSIASRSANSSRSA